MRKLICLLSIAAMAGCQPAISPDAATPAAPVATTATPATPPGRRIAASPAFAGKVWRVQSSSAGDASATYAFLDDGTLIVDSAHGTPMQGQWRYEDGQLTLVEEGIAYSTDIVRLDATTFELRSHNPGGTVDIVLVPAPDRALPERDSSKAAPPMPGSDRDAHGCKPSAGYTWCARTNKCERPWELARANGFENTREGYEKFCATPAK